MGSKTRNVWILRFDELEELLTDIMDQIPTLDPAPTDEYSKGLKSGLNLAIECAKRRMYEALEYDIEATKAEA